MQSRAMRHPLPVPVPPKPRLSLRKRKERLEAIAADPLTTAADRRLALVLVDVYAAELAARQDGRIVEVESTDADNP